jgi:hypothetical protein
MVRLIGQLNSVRDPSLVERILIANSRTYVGEIDAHDFITQESLMKRVREMKDDNKPFVVRHAALQWKVVQRFNDAQALLEQAKLENDSAPDRKYSVYQPESDGYLNQTHAAPYGFMTFYQFLIKAKQKGLYLLGGMLVSVNLFRILVPEKDGRRGASPFEMRKNDTSMPIFAQDIDSDPLPQAFIGMFTGSLSSRRHVFFNSCRSRTNLHYDTDANMYVELFKFR